MPDHDISRHPADDSRDDGGTPQHGARQHAKHMAPIWAVIRFIWLFPLVAIGAALVTACAWFFLAVLIGEPKVVAIWWMVVLFGIVVAWEQIVGKGGGFGAGALDFRGMVNSPSGGAWGAIATYFRSVFVLAYACYALFFWFIAGVAIWAWQSGAWERAMASIGSG